MSKLDTPRESLTARLRAYIPVEGQEGLRVRDALMREAADEIERLQRRINDVKYAHDDDMRAAAAEARWQERQGEDYGSY